MVWLGCGQEGQEGEAGFLVMLDPSIVKVKMALLPKDGRYELSRQAWSNQYARGFWDPRLLSLPRTCATQNSSPKKTAGGL